MFALLLVTSICFAAASGSHGNTNPLPPPPPTPPQPPPPRNRRMVGQHQAWEEDLDRLRSLHHHLDAVVSLVTTQKNNNEQTRKELQEQDKALHEVMNSNKQMHQMLQEQDKVLDEILQETRSILRKRKQEAAGQAHIMDEGTGSTYQLRFHGSLKARIYTNKPLLEQSDERIEIAIYRDGQIITSGDLSSVKVEIVALDKDLSCKGSWTEEDFRRQIQTRRGGQGSVLKGARSVKLVNGKASLGKVWFIEGTTGRGTEFVLAARIDRSENTEGLRVEEAFMQPAITVLVERSKANEKSVLPRLNDKVHRLKGIAKGYSQRLELHGICTVQDFLKALNKDENKLRQILEMKSEKSWKVLVGHARECDLSDEHELKEYMVAGENARLFFNCIHDNVGAKFHELSPYVAKDNFGPVQKALVDRLKKQAYNELDGIDFQYVMKDNRPVKISANDNAAGSSSIPMPGASLRNTPDHHAHAVSQAVEKLGPSGVGPVPESNLPLGGANCNAAGPSASDPSPHYLYAHQNQGVADISIPEGGDIRPGTATTDVVDWAEFLADMQDSLTHTPHGPDSDLFTAGGQFQNFRPPEEPTDILSTAPSGSETPRSMNLYNSTFPGPDSDLFTPGDQFQTSPPEDPTAPSGSGGGN